MEKRFIPVCEPSITALEVEYVKGAVESGWISSLGEFISAFEENFARYIGVQHAICVSNGTAALHLALVALGIGKGDEVIVPDLTFVATASSVVYTGATPVFVDVNKDTWCIDPDDLRKKISPKTKAVIVVHLYGHPVDMDAICEIVEQNGLLVIEDAAQAHGAEYKGKRVGSFGKCATFSFYGNKIITTGEGGMITTNDDKLNENIRFLRDHAMSKEKRYWHTSLGFNYRMTNLQAALGVAQLERIEELIQKKRQVFEWYKKRLLNSSKFLLNPEKEWAKNVFWMCCIVLNSSNSIARDDLILYLRQKGIDTRPFFYPLSELPIFHGKALNPVAKELSYNGLSLPSSVNLNEDDVEYICQCLENILRNKI